MLPHKSLGIRCISTCCIITIIWSICQWKLALQNCTRRVFMKLATCLFVNFYKLSWDGTAITTLKRLPEGYQCLPTLDLYYVILSPQTWKYKLAELGLDQILEEFGLHERAETRDLCCQGSLLGHSAGPNLPRIRRVQVQSHCQVLDILESDKGIF